MSLSQEEIAKYWEIFQSQAPENGIVSGPKMSALLKNSQLQDQQLAKIWDLADIDGDGGVDFDEFCIAMRLVFDVLQSPNQGIPNMLPQWLVPASKRHLIKSNDDEDDEYKLSTDFDWYISPADRNQYLDIYSAHSNVLGQVSFDSMAELYKTLRIPDTDVSSAWNLVNPRSDERIDKEQCIVFLHILNKRSQKVRIPRSVPASLRATFGKQQPSHSVNGSQAQIKQSTGSEDTGFASTYLSRLGLGGRQKITSAGTDFSATKDVDWEEVRLKRELEEVEVLTAQLLERKNQPAQKTSDLSIIKRELQMFLDYKERCLKVLESASSSDLQGLRQAKDEIDLLDEQVNGLKEHLKQKEAELAALKN